MVDEVALLEGDEMTHSYLDKFTIHANDCTKTNLYPIQIETLIPAYGEL